MGSLGSSVTVFGFCALTETVVAASSVAVSSNLIILGSYVLLSKKQVLLSKEPVDEPHAQHRINLELVDGIHIAAHLSADVFHVMYQVYSFVGYHLW